MYAASFPHTPHVAAAASSRPASRPSAVEFKELESEVKDLSARVDGLEQLAPTSTPETHAATSTAAQAGPTCLQELLPEIKNLAEKVGGLERLAGIIDNLKQAKQ
jgi:outer membrane murein-binding lipoprotein Lpp